MSDDIHTVRADYAEAMEMLWRQSQTIKRLQKENEKLRTENETHKEIAVRETMKVATLRAALKPFAIDVDDYDFMDDQDIVGVAVGDLRAAAAALNDVKSDK